MTGPGWSSLASVDLLVSLRVPRGWDVSAPDEATLRVQRDGADEHGYRATVTVRGGAPDQPGREWFDQLAAVAPARLAADVPGFDLIRTERFVLSSLAPVVAVHARQHAPGLPPTTQLQAWIWVNSYRLLSVGATTLSTHEDRDLGVFDAILHSVRILPHRPDVAGP